MTKQPVSPVKAAGAVFAALANLVASLAPATAPRERRLFTGRGALDKL